MPPLDRSFQPAVRAKPAFSLLPSQATSISSKSAHMIDHPIPAHAVEWRGELGQGTATDTHLVNARDNEGNRVDLVVKFRQPSMPQGRGHYGRTSLACELICSMLGRALDLPVPDYYVVKITGTFVNALRGADRGVITLFSHNEGYVFGTRNLNSHDDWPQGKITQNDQLLDTFEDTICFDGAVFNGDRTIQNPNALWDGDTSIALIDHALALAAVYAKKSRSANPSQPFPKKNIRRHFATPSLQNDKNFKHEYEDLYERWEELITPSVLSTIRDSIPDAWERQHSGDLDAIFNFLKDRGTCFCQTVDNIKDITQ